MNTLTWKSQNGRWGVSLIGQDLDTRTSYTTIVSGAAVDRGIMNGVHTVEVRPTDDDQLVVMVRCHGLTAIAGCEVVASRDLQGRGNNAYIVSARVGSLIQMSTNNGSTYQIITEKGFKEAPLGILIAAGVVTPPKEDLKPAPEFSGSMLLALQKVGIK